jgi:CheY-like chemotaxis protein
VLRGDCRRAAARSSNVRALRTVPRAGNVKCTLADIAPFDYAAANLQCADILVTEIPARHSLLVVDDEPDSLETLRLLLIDEGFDVRVAANGSEALQLVAERMPDLMIVDVMMPLMTGLDLCRQLRAQAETRHIPCIAYSGYPMRQQRGDEHPYDRVMLKPTDFSELLHAVRELLAERSR